MKVLQNKLLILIVSSALIPVLVVMAIAFSNYGRIVENNSGQIMQHTYLYENSILSVENQSVENYRWNDTDKRLTAQKLRNGMIYTDAMTQV